MSTGLVDKHLLGIEGLAREEIERVLDTAEAFFEVSRRPIRKVPTLRGKTVLNLFYEASTRTRTSFELAGKRLTFAELTGLAHVEQRDLRAVLKPLLEGRRVDRSGHGRSCRVGARGNVDYMTAVAALRAYEGRTTMLRMKCGEHTPRSTTSMAASFNGRHERE